MSETTIDRLQAEENKAAYDSRQAERDKLIEALEGAKQAEDKAGLLKALKEAGLAFGEGFENKELSEIQKAVDDAITELQEYSANIVVAVASTKDGVEEEVVKAEATTNPEVEAGEPVSIERAREILGEHLQTTEDVDTMLEADGWRVVNSESYPTTLNATEKELQDYVAHAIANTREKEGRDQTPWVSIEIKQVENIETGKKEDMTDEWILNWLKTTKNPNLKGKYAEFTGYARTKARKQVGNGEWYYMFSDGVAGSNESETCSGTEKGQVEYLTGKLGSGEMALDPNLFKAAVLHCSKTGEMRFDDIWVRTEGKDTAGDRVRFGSWAGDGEFGLDGTRPDYAYDFLFASRGSRSPRNFQFFTKKRLSKRSLFYCCSFLIHPPNIRPISSIKP